jgi:hypothetical protein
LNLSRTAYLALSIALAFTPALYATQETPVVKSLGTTSLAQAHQRSLAAQASSTGVPRRGLPFFPRPHFSNAAGVSSTQGDTGQAIEFPIVGPDATQHGFSGVDSRDQDVANGGGPNNDLEPPDQGLATNGTQVFEAVNLAFRIFTQSGTPLSDAIDFNSFFGVPSQDSATTFNALSDPRVFFDPQSKRFFLTILEFQFNGNTGHFLGSEDLLAVSETSDATGNYFLYSVDVSLHSNTACKPGCLADQPLIGVNDDGFYFSNNQFAGTLSGGPFVGALITALDKQALIHNTTVHGTAYLLPTDFSVEPALPAPGAVTTQNNGTEYFMESLDNGPPANGNSLRILAITNTETLSHTTIATILSASNFATEPYSFPPDAIQKAGSFPLGQHFGDKEERLATDDDRMLQLYYANGKLYTTLETAVHDADDSVPVRTAAAWFVITPGGTSTHVSAHITQQGYIGIKNGSVLYPAFAVNDSGQGVIGFSFSGTNYFPSTGYVRYSSGSLEQEIHIAGVGTAPEDGFSGYPQFGGNGVARWGDYSAAVVSPGGHLWFAAEFIPNDIRQPRTPFTNWGTFISRLQ